MVSAPCFANTAATTVIEASDPAVQYIGRFVDDARTGGKMFDMPGCEIRARLQLAAPATVKVTLAQCHLPKPDPAPGNTGNSGFEANAFQAFVDVAPLSRRRLPRPSAPPALAVPRCPL